MDLIEHYLLKDLNINPKKIKLPEFNIIEKHCLDSYMEITRHLQEIDQLFNIFRFNLKNLLNSFELNNNDLLLPKYKFDFEEDDNLIINSLVISYLSAGKTLKESIDSFMKKHFGEASEKYIAFNTNCLQKIYDENFHYRLLLRLRDFAQHGHLPVTVIGPDNHCCFNLHHILFTPHFKHNKQLEEQIKKIIEDISTQYSDYPHIAFTISIAEFNLCTTQIYMDFLNSIEELLINSRSQIDLLLKKREDIIYKSKDAFNGFVFYDFYNNSIHCFNPSQDPIKMISDIKITTSALLEKSKTELELLTKSNEKYILL